MAKKIEMKNGHKKRVDALWAINRAKENGTLKSMAMTGASDRQIWETLGIGKTAFYRYLKKDEEFKNLVRETHLTNVQKYLSRLDAVTVERRYKVVKKHVQQIKDKNNKVVKTITDGYEEDVVVQPNVQATIWLAKVYMNAVNRDTEGTPTEAIEVVQAPITQDNGNGRLLELDEALVDLFFGDDDGEDSRRKAD